MIRGRIGHMRNPQSIQRKEEEQPAFRGEQEGQRLRLRAAAALKHPQAAAENEASQRDHRPHGGLRLTLRQVIGQ